MENAEHLSTPVRGNDIELRVGMEFLTLEEVENQYTEHGKRHGFAIIRRNSIDKVVQFSCHKEGVPRKRKKSNGNEDVGTSIQRSNRSGTSVKVGCRASLHVSLESSSKLWCITKFDDVHNHGMLTPKSLKFVRGTKQLTNSARSLAAIFDSQNIPVGKVPNVLYSTLGEARFTSKDCYNYLGSLRRRVFDVGDAQSVYEYCSRQKDLHPDFRFSIQMDEEDRMKNFFWVDPRSRKAYEKFGEVISFDTTYRTNKYKMPFAPFVGIDNHMHTILFGCALLQDETEETFTWLFKVWLESMNDKHPLGIITDQDMTMMKAIATVFPNSQHRLCIWHITKKFSERLSHVYHDKYHDKSNFKFCFNHCIHKSITTEGFELEFQRLVEEYGLTDNVWLQHLYSLRHMWVPVFSKDFFFGGMNSTQRSESINSFFNKFVDSGTTLKDFVDKFGNAIDTRYETFRRAEFDSRHKVPTLSLGMAIEEHAASVYTSEIFKLFRIELSTCLSFFRQLISSGDSNRSYKISSRKDVRSVFRVDYELYTHSAKCECKLWESKGILCNHSLLVLFENNVEIIPPQYILKRWTKGVACDLWDYSVARDTPTNTNVRSFEFK